MTIRRWEMSGADIRPSIDLDSDDPMEPTFTTAEAMASAASFYARSRRMDRATTRTGPLEHVTARFMPASELTREMLDGGYEPRSGVVCLVNLSGKDLYHFGRPHQNIIITRSFLIFDGKSGDLLKWGILRDFTEAEKWHPGQHVS